MRPESSGNLESDAGSPATLPQQQRPSIFPLAIPSPLQTRELRNLSEGFSEEWQARTRATVHQALAEQGVDDQQLISEISEQVRSDFEQRLDELHQLEVMESDPPVESPRSMRFNALHAEKWARHTMLGLARTRKAGGEEDQPFQV